MLPPSVRRGLGRIGRIRPEPRGAAHWPRARRSARGSKEEARLGAPPNHGAEPEGAWSRDGGGRGRGVATELGGALLGSPTKELLLLAAALPEALGWSAAQLEPAGLSVPTVARALRDSAGRC